MKLSSFIAIIFLLAAAIAPGLASAQPGGRAISSLLRLVGEAAVSTVVENEVERLFYEAPQTENTFKVTVKNDFPYHSISLFTTTDGYNWDTYFLYPGQYFTTWSSRQGLLGVHTGWTYYIVSRSGTYSASSFFR